MLNPKLVEILKKLDPKGEVFTEAVQKELADIVNEKVTSTKEQVLTEANETFQKKIEAIDADYAKKLKTFSEAINTNHAKKLSKFHKTIDKNYAGKTKKLVEALNENHSKKIQKLYDTLDADRAKKLENIKDLYENKMQKKFVESVESYLDTYLEEVTPKQKLANVAKLQRYEKMFESVKNIFVETEIKNMATKEIKEGVKNAKSIIEEKEQALANKEKELNSVILEKVQLTSKIKKMEAKQLLESKLKDLTPATQSYMRKCFDGKDSKVITEGFDAALKSFKEEKQQTRQTVIAESKKKDEPKVVIEPKKETKVVTESVESKDVFSAYVSNVRASVGGRR